MKNLKTILLLCLAVSALRTPHSALADPTMITNPVYNGRLDNPTVNTPTVTGPTVTGQTNTDLTASLPVFTDANKALASKSVAATKTALGIQSGTCVTTTDGTVTQTFSTAFSSAPIVIATQTGPPNTTSNYVTAVTASSFIIKTQLTGVTNNWTAIGAP